MKYCPRFGESKLESEFYDCKKNWDGKQNYCKLCSAESNKKSRLAPSMYNCSCSQKRELIADVMEEYDESSLDACKRISKEIGYCTGTLQNSNGIKWSAYRLAHILLTGNDTGRAV